MFQSSRNFEAASFAAFRVNVEKAIQTLISPTELNKGIPEKNETEFVINDLPMQAKLSILKRNKIDEIMKFSGAYVCTKGRYISPDERSKLTLKEKPLYLDIRGPNKQSLMLAIKLLEKVVYEAMGEDNTAPPTGVEKVLIGMDNAPITFGVREKLLGECGSNLAYIKSETGAEVSLRGQNSRYLEPGTGLESPEPLHIRIEHQRAEVLQAARILAMHLLETVQEECTQFCQQMQPPKLQLTVPPVGQIMTIPPPVLCVPPPFSVPPPPYFRPVSHNNSAGKQSVAGNSVSISEKFSMFQETMSDFNEKVEQTEERQKKQKKRGGKKWRNFNAKKKALKLQEEEEEEQKNSESTPEEYSKGQKSNETLMKIGTNSNKWDRQDMFMSETQMLLEQPCHKSSLEFKSKLPEPYEVEMSPEQLRHLSSIENNNHLQNHRMSVHPYEPQSNSFPQEFRNEFKSEQPRKPMFNSNEQQEQRSSHEAGNKTQWFKMPQNKTMQQQNYQGVQNQQPRTITFRRFYNDTHKNKTWETHNQKDPLRMIFHPSHGQPLVQNQRGTYSQNMSEVLQIQSSNQWSLFDSRLQIQKDTRITQSHTSSELQRITDPQKMQIGSKLENFLPSNEWERSKSSWKIETQRESGLPMRLALDEQQHSSWVMQTQRNKPNVSLLPVSQEHVKSQLPWRANHNEINQSRLLDW